MLQNLTQGKRLIFLIIGAFVLLGAIAVTLYQVQRSQESRSRASSAPPVTVSLETISPTVKVGDQVTVYLKVKAGSNDLGAASGTIDFSNTVTDGLFEFVSFSQDTLLPIASPGVNPQGVITFIGTNTTITPVTGDTVSLGKLILKAKKPGTGKVTMKVQFTATGYKEFVPLANTSIIQTDLIVTSPLSPTPDCRSGVNMVNGCQCYSDAECASQTCRQVVAENEVGYCVTLGTTPTIFPSITPTVIPTITPTPSPSNTPTPTVFSSPTPTKTPTATPTPIPGQASISLVTKLPGIGEKTSNNNNNPDPKHPSRFATDIAIFKQGSDQPVYTVSGNATYSSELFAYNRVISVPINATGNVLVKIRFDNSLWKQVPGIVYLEAGAPTVVINTGTLILGDLNRNNRMDTLDYNLFVACYQGKESCTAEQKVLADFNDNGEFDIIDNAIIVNAFLSVEGD